MAAATLASPTMIRNVKREFAAGGVARVLGSEPRPGVVAWWLIVVVRWRLRHTLRDFGFLRTRWSCALLALPLWERVGLRLSPETVRRGLRRMPLVWRRPRPVVGPRVPRHESILRGIRRRLAQLPADETVVFQDEVDVPLNPQIGSQWMLRGPQAQVVTPGNHQQRRLAGSLHWRTGRLLLSPPGTRRNAQRFLAHRDDRRCRRRAFRKIPAIGDNARFHNCRAVRQHLAQWGHRIELHYLPKDAPETIPIERVWWHLRATITGHHHGPSIEELLEAVYDWAKTQSCFSLQTASFRSQYHLAA
jgi:transposase